METGSDKNAFRLSLFFGHIHSMWKFPGQGSDPSHSSDHAGFWMLGYQGTLPLVFQYAFPLSISQLPPALGFISVFIAFYRHLRHNPVFFFFFKAFIFLFQAFIVSCMQRPCLSAMRGRKMNQMWLRPTRSPESKEKENDTTQWVTAV